MLLLYGYDERDLRKCPFLSMTMDLYSAYSSVKFFSIGCCTTSCSFHGVLLLTIYDYYSNFDKENVFMEGDGKFCSLLCHTTY